MISLLAFGSELSNGMVDRLTNAASFSFTHSVADMNQSLIDDGLVDKEKIGGSNYFWSFPAKKDRMMEIQHENVLKATEQLKTSVAEANAALLDAKRGREDEEVEEEAKVGETKENEEKKEGEAKTGDGEEAKEGEAKSGEGEEETKAGEEEEVPPPKRAKTVSRAAKLQRLNEIAKERAAIESELETLKENDPQALADLEKELELVTQAANRWTDNIFNCKSYLTKKRGMDKKEACKLLGITSAFDCTYSFLIFCAALTQGTQTLTPLLLF